MANYAMAVLSVLKKPNGEVKLLPCVPIFGAVIFYSRMFPPIIYFSLDTSTTWGHVFVQYYPNLYTLPFHSISLLKNEVTRLYANKKDAMGLIMAYANAEPNLSFG